MPDSQPVIRRANERFCTRTSEGDKETWHSFSFGNHYDPNRIGFGPLMAINEERLAPGAGYEPHKHAGVDILTWVLSGTLKHEDSTGDGGLIRQGTLQHLNAGSGVTHSEVNASTTEPLVFVQMMVRADADVTPHYGQIEISEGPGLHRGPEVTADAVVYIARLASGDTVLTPEATAVFLHVTVGAINVAGEILEAGDEWAGPSRLLTEITGVSASEAILWLVE